MPVRRPAFETEGARLLIQLYASRTGGCEIFVTKLGDQNAETEALSAPEEALLRRVFGNAPSIEARAGQCRRSPPG